MEVGIEGRQGSIGLWAQDDLFYNHYLLLNWSGRSFSLAFEHLNLMPFDEHPAESHSRSSPCA